MSYILEALKKSESERNQGRVPDLGQQMRMVHRGRKRGIPAAAWVALALALNAVVVAGLFWPGVGLWSGPADVAESPGSPGLTADSGAADTNGPAGPASVTSGEIETSEETPPQAAEITAATGELESQGAIILDTVDEAPTVIVPTVRQSSADGEPAYTPEPWEGRVPHLVEMPMAFQRQVPDLVFNSHVYSSQPGARSVMINNRYLRMGDTLGPLRIERITEEGVELSMNGQRFRVGVVRDWSSPR